MVVQTPPDLGGGHVGSATMDDKSFAVIGMGCRLPGCATSPDKLWQLLSEARSAWTQEPPDGRFRMSQFYDSQIGKLGSLFTKGAHFLKEDVALFDRKFFNISVTEATAMDPQIRLILEIAFETFENAGYSMDRLAQSRTGVFVGSWSRDYNVHLERDPENAPMYQSTGTAASIVSNRISHFFDLKGPSFTVDTACSSSLVALHQAVLSMANGDAECAFVGGVNLILDPTASMALGRMRLLSPDGRSYAFDERANGYGRGEGVGGIFLKPLSAAIRDGDSIRAIVRSSAVNQDGYTPGITLPSGLAQEHAIERAYTAAKLEKEADYVECHGTGTSAGDLTETKAVASVLARGRSPEDPLVIGSIKSSIGHLEAAAGIASIIKSVLMLEKGQIPPQALLENLTSAVDFQGLRIQPSQRLQKPERLDRISINSFGFGGANAHVVLEKAPDHLRQVSSNSGSVTNPLQTPHLAIISSVSEKGCKDVAARLSQFIVENPQLTNSASFCQDLAFSLGKRTLHPYRVAVVYHDVYELIDKLDHIQSGTISVEKAISDHQSLYVFTGQGAQWFAMARELLDYEPFQKRIKLASAVFKTLDCDWDIVEELGRAEDESRVNEPTLSQPICTVVQLCLVDLMRDLGISPTATVGHSSGELAAAYAAGAISFEGACIGAYHRGYVVGEAIREKTIQGSMLAVGLDAAKTEEYLAQVNDQTSEAIVACHNSSSSVTVSGDDEAVFRLHKLLQKEQVFSRLLKTNGAAYHSHHMKRIAAKLLESMARIKPGQVDTSVRWVSSVTAEDQAGVKVTAEYWCRNLISPVLFPQALSSACRSSSQPNTIIELGPHSALAGPVKQTLKSIGMMNSIRYTNALARGQNAAVTFLSMVGSLIVRGQNVDMAAVHRLFSNGSLHYINNLPSYPWEHDTRYWHESRLSSEYRARAFQRHELLGVRCSDFNPVEPSWRNYVRLSEIPWLKGHAVHGQVIWPGAGFIAMAVEAVRQTWSARGQLAHNPRYVLRDVVFSRAMVLRDEVEDTEINLKLRALPTSATESSSVWNEFRIFTLSRNNEPQEHCRGLVAIDSSKVPEIPVLSEIDVEHSAKMHIDAADFYRTFRGLGMGWRDAFAGINDILAGPESSICTVQQIPSALPELSGPSLTAVHPGILDSLFQASFATMIPADRPAAKVITSIDELDISFSPSGQSREDLKVLCTASPRGYDIGTIADDSQPFAVRMRGFQITEVPGEDGDGDSDRQTVFNLEWKQLSPEDLSALFRSDAGEVDHTEPVLNGNVPSLSVVASQTQVSQPNGDLNDYHTTNEEYAEGKPIASHLQRTTAEVLQQLGEEAVRPKIQILGDRNDPLLNDLGAELRRCSGQDMVEAQDWDFASPASDTCIIIDAPETPLLHDLRSGRFQKLQDLVKAAINIVWITRGATGSCSGPKASTVSGFVNTIRVENPALRIVTLDVDSHGSEPDTLASLVTQIIHGNHFAVEADSFAFDYDLAYHESQWYAPRVIPCNELSTRLAEQGSHPEPKDTPFFSKDPRPMRIAPGQPGLLDSLRWEDRNVQDLAPKPDEVIFETRAHGVNFRDLLVAIGQLGQGPDAVMAGECAGVVTAVGSEYENEFKIGDRVCAFGAQAYPNYAQVPGHRCVKIPENVAFEVAASIPIVYSTVVYALLHIAQVEKGSKILIHSATGGVGQAAVMLAQYVGAEVFATVGNADKKELLIKEFNVPEDRIFSSRDTKFKQQIMDITDGYGVDMILNSLSGEMFRESCNCLASFGHFVEIGKRDLIANSRMEMRFFLKNASFTAMDLMVIGKKKPRLCKQLLTQAMDFVATGQMKSLKMMTAPITDIGSVFRKMQAGKHVGKMILTAQRDTEVKAVPRIEAGARFKSDSSYLIIGGLGGLGRTMTRWMAKKGAKHIITLSRTGLRSPTAQKLIKEMLANGVMLHVLECDAANEPKLISSLDNLSRNIPPIKGVFQAAMVLQDAVFEQMNYSQWSAATLPKIQATQNLHNYFPTGSLDFFITLSSVVSVVGNTGQAAYAAANSYLDGLARHRTAVATGSSGISHSINVGVVSDAGVVSQNTDLARTLASRGYSTITVKDLLNLMDYIIAHPSQFITPETSQTIMGLGTDNRALRGRKFAPWLEICGDNSPDDSSSTAKDQLDLRLAGSPAEALAIATALLTSQLAKLLSVDPASVEAGSTLASYGIDSLISVELRNWIRAELRAAVPLLEINEAGRTVGGLGKLVAERSSLCR